MNNSLKTVLLLGLLSGLLLAIGELLGGSQGLVMAFGFAVVMNFVSYWFSDKIVLKMYRAQEVGPDHRLSIMTRRLATQAEPADAEGLRDSGRVAERVCDRAQPEPCRRGGHRRDHAAAERSGARRGASRTSWRT